MKFLAALLALIYPDSLPHNHPAIHYSSPVSTDPISRLDPTKLSLDLKTLLRNLDINPDTQALTFAKSSFQANRISPRTPRAIYFNDEVAVGYVPGGNGFELTSLDPRQGVIFYTLRPENGQPVLRREEVCLHCHHGPSTMGVPGLFIGSVFPNAVGVPAREGAIVTDHSTPFADRWGGWFIHSTRGEQPDRANAVAPDPAETQTLEKIPAAFDARSYPTATSDIVALMTFEHQTQMTNLLIRLGWDARLSLPIEADLEATVRYLLFLDEAPLPEPLEGVSTFTQTFPRRGPLRDFDLRTRLFRFPVSYMILSPLFEALPASVKDRIYNRVEQHLTAPDRATFLNILKRSANASAPPAETYPAQSTTPHP